MPINYSIYYSNWHDQSPEHADAVASDLWQQFMKWAPPDRSESILDIGCGYGFLLQAFKSAGYLNISGLEASEQQALTARKHGHLVDVTSDTVGWLQDRTKAFGTIFLLDVLEHIEPAQHIAVLEAIRGSLKPGGLLVIQVPNANSIVASRWRYNDWTHYTSFTEHSLRFILQCSGFTNLSINNNKGLDRLPRRLWRRSARIALRKWLVRWLWLQVYKAELPHEKLNDISFDLNLVATAHA